MLLELGFENHMAKMQMQGGMKDWDPRLGLLQQVCPFLVLATTFLMKEKEACTVCFVSDSTMFTHGDAYGDVLLLLTYLSYC